jgi:hypothetical protein
MVDAKEEKGKEINASLFLWILGAIITVLVIIVGIINASIFSPDFIALISIIFFIGGSIIFALFSISLAIANR